MLFTFPAFLLNEPDFAENKQKPYSEDPIVVVDFIGNECP